MKVGGTLFDPRSAARARFGRRVEKANGSNRFADEAADQAVAPARFFERRRSQRSSRFDTRSFHDPEQNGTSSAFVAQVLGQILDTERPNPIAGARVYARASRGPAETHTVRVL